MRIDIAGHGFVPTLNINAPASGIEANLFEIKFLLGYRNLLVSVADTPIMITTRNVETIYAQYNGKQSLPKQPKKIVSKTLEEPVQEKPVFEPLPEITNNEVLVEEKVCEPIVVEEEQNEESIVDLDNYSEPVVTLEEVSTKEEVVDESEKEESVTEEKHFNNSKKKNKKRNRNHHDN